MTGPQKPIPVPDELSSGFWAATARHELAMQQCVSCTWYAYPPNIICTNCLVDPPEFAWAVVSGRGFVKSWTVLRDAFLPGFTADTPYAVGDIELLEQPGLRMIAQVRDIAADELSCGLPVRVEFDDVAEGAAVPYFVPVQS